MRIMKKDRRRRATSGSRAVGYETFMGSPITKQEYIAPAGQWQRTVGVVEILDQQATVTQSQWWIRAHKSDIRSKDGAPWRPGKRQIEADRRPYKRQHRYGTLRADPCPIRHALFLAERIRLPRLPDRLGCYRVAIMLYCHHLGWHPRHGAGISSHSHLLEEQASDQHQSGDRSLTHGLRHAQNNSLNDWNGKTASRYALQPHRHPHSPTTAPHKGRVFLQY